MSTKNYVLAASADDAREVAGTVTLTDSNIAMTAGTHYAGFSYDTSADPIAQGAPITSATWTFTPQNTSNDTPGGMIIKGEKVVNSAQFTTGASNISNRYNNNPTTASVTDSGTDVGTGARNEDVTAIVQELVNQASWGATSRITLPIKGAGGTVLSIKAYDGGSSYPTLQVVVADAAITPKAVYFGRMMQS